MNRATIIHYNPTEGCGTVNVTGQPYDFTVQHWQGCEAPTPNRIVDVILRDGAVSALIPVAESQLMQEKANELKNVISGHGQQALGKGLALYGKPAMAAYALFIIASVMFDFVRVKGLGLSTSGDLLSLLTQYDYMRNGSYKLMWYAAVLAPLLALWINDRRAWLTLLSPLALLLIFFLSIFNLYRDAVGTIRESVGAFGGSAEMVERAMSQYNMSQFIQPGFGLYICFGAAAALALFGLRKFIVRN